MTDSYMKCLLMHVPPLILFLAEQDLIITTSIKPSHLRQELIQSRDSASLLQQVYSEPQGGAECSRKPAIFLLLRSLPPWWQNPLQAVSMTIKSCMELEQHTSQAAARKYIFISRARPKVTHMSSRIRYSCKVKNLDCNAIDLYLRGY